MQGFVCVLREGVESKGLVCVRNVYKMPEAAAARRLAARIHVALIGSGAEAATNHGIAVRIPCNHFSPARRQREILRPQLRHQRRLEP